MSPPHLDSTTPPPTTHTHTHTPHSSISAPLLHPSVSSVFGVFPLSSSFPLFSVFPSHPVPSSLAPLLSLSNLFGGSLALYRDHLEQPFVGFSSAFSSPSLFSGTFIFYISEISTYLHGAYMHFSKKKHKMNNNNNPNKYYINNSAI